MASDSTGWPVLEDRGAPLGHVRRGAAKPKPRRRPRSPWLLSGLAFLCGALVSAAVFTIGWRHQTLQNSAAESALAKATARNHTLAASLATARAADARDRRVAAPARASARSLARAGAAVATQANAAKSAAGSVSSDAADMSASVAKVANELKTLTTYLTTTPPSQLDAGYIQSQASYLQHQMNALQAQGGSLGDAVTSFGAATRKLSGLAAALAARN
jgi:hypothetical protein